jgi:hypothetical protein
MNNELLINQAHHLFVLLNTKQKALDSENKMGFDRLYPIVRRAFRRYHRRLRCFSKPEYLF